MDMVKSIVTASRQRTDRHRLPWPLLAISLLLLGVTSSLPVHGHGFMTEPRPREMDDLKGDRRGWPIAGVPAYLTKPPCLSLPPSKHFTEVQPGPLRLRFFYGDGANHVGLCQVFLIDPADPTKKVKIAEMMDCARTDHPGPGRKGEDLTGHMMVTIPSNVPCDPAHCVLQWVWIATHRSVTRPEYYDNCADIAIADAHETTVTAALSVPPQRTKNPAPRPHEGGPPQLAHGEDLVRQMIAEAEVNRGSGNAEAIMALKHRIEALPLNRDLDPGAHQQARNANQRGLDALRNGHMAEAVQAFQTAYQLAPTDVEIVNNFGYAYLQHDDPGAAEAWLLLTLVLAPERVNAWVNLGEAYAEQGEASMAVACLANGYRFSKNQTATRAFLQKLADDLDQDAAVRSAVQRTLQLPMMQAGKS